MDLKNRQEFAREVRTLLADPQRLNRFDVYAHDILIDGLDDDRLISDPDLEGLEDSEREAFVDAQASRLAEALSAFSLGWALTNLQSVREWRAAVQ